MQEPRWNAARQQWLQVVDAHETIQRDGKLSGIYCTKGIQSHCHATLQFGLGHAQIERLQIEMDAIEAKACAQVVHYQSTLFCKIGCPDIDGNSGRVVRKRIYPHVQLVQRNVGSIETVPHAWNKGLVVCQRPTLPSYSVHSVHLII